MIIIFINVLCCFHLLEPVYVFLPYTNDTTLTPDNVKDLKALVNGSQGIQWKNRIKIKYLKR